MDFPPSSLPLVESLLSIDPGERATATAALNSEVDTALFYIFVACIYLVLLQG